MVASDVGPSYAASQAWIRARLSRLLDTETWRHLLASPTPADLARNLRGAWIEPALTPAIKEAPRIRLRILRGEVASAAATVSRFLPRHPKQLLDWYNRRFELENLKIILRSIHYKVDRQRTLESLIPLHPDRLPWDLFLQCGSIAVLLDQLRDSPYARPLHQALSRYQQEQRVFYLEAALDLFYFQQLVRLIESQTGADKAGARVWLGQWIAVQNLMWAYRYRIYGRMSTEEILNFTLHRAFAAGLDLMRRAALGSPLALEAQRLGFRLSPHLPESEALTELETLAERQRYRAAVAALSRPLFQLAGVWACLEMLESEIRDIGVLAEAKIAGLTEAEIRPRLLREV